jgi:L-lactate dehydrogenase complex protein LldE
MPQVGVSVVEVFERLGHSVDYPRNQTCCGQPAFNGGFHPEAREVATTFLNAFRDSRDPVVVPSGSCAAMVKVFYPELFAGTPREAEARLLAARTWEFSSFIVEQLGVTDLGATFAKKVTFHDGCHGLRELGIQSAPRKLLEKVKGLQLAEMKECATCCGFGGSFAVKYAPISTAMAEVKCKSAYATGAEVIVSNDPSCLMQINGYAEKQGMPVKCLHLAEVLNSR